jgi:DNA topoisomerase I
MPRLRHVSAQQPGWTRRRAGRGFVYLDGSGERLDGDDAERCRSLVIPPAWRDVWICPFPNGHLQAVGTDDAGRRQYLYHPEWQRRREQAKYDHVLELAEDLPRARRRARRHLAQDGASRERTLALAFLLLDGCLFRIGTQRYTEDNGSHGLVTLERQHTRVERDRVRFDFPAKSGRRQEVTLADMRLREAVRDLRARRRRADRLLAFKDGRRWRDLSTEDVNDYVKDLLGDEATAKDLRTWHGTASAAVTLSRYADASSATARRRAVSHTMREVADYLGNTPAVARSAYVDPRVVERFEEGLTLGAVGSRHEIGVDGPPFPAAVERAVVRLLYG